MELRSKINKHEHEFIERLADNFGVPAVLDEVRAICEAWSERAGENANPSTEQFYALTAASLKTLVAHLRHEIAKLES